MRKWIFAVILTLLTTAAYAQQGGSGPGMSPPPVTSLTNGTISGQTNATGAVFTGATPFCFEGATDNTVDICLGVTNPTGPPGTVRTFYLPWLQSVDWTLVTDAGNQVNPTTEYWQMSARSGGAYGNFNSSIVVYNGETTLNNDPLVATNGNKNTVSAKPNGEFLKSKDDNSNDYASLVLNGGSGSGIVSANFTIYDDANVNAPQQEVAFTETGMTIGSIAFQPIVINPQPLLPLGSAYFIGTITTTPLTGNHTYTLPDATGTVALLETLPGPTGTYSDAFIKNIGGAGFRYSLEVDDYALTNTLNDYSIDGSYYYPLVVSITDTTPSIVGGNVRICGKSIDTAPYGIGQNGVTVCENVSCAGAVAAPVTTAASWTLITHVESSCSVLDGGGDETITVKWPSFDVGEFVVASTNVVAPATAYSAEKDFGLTNLAMLTCDDADGCTTHPAAASPGGDIGRELTLLAESAASVVISDVDGDVELSGDADLTLGQYDSLTLVWVGDRWIQKSASNN